MKKFDVFFIFLIFISVIFYIVLCWFNFLRFYSLNPLSLSPGVHEQFFRWITSRGYSPTNLYALSFPSPELFLLPIVFLGSYFLGGLYWLLDTVFNFHIPYSDIILSIQPLFLLLPAIPLYKIAHSLIQDKELAFAVAFSYLISQIVFIGSSIGFIFTSIGLLFFICEFYGIFRKRFWIFLVSAVLVNATKIDLIVANIVFGLTLVLVLREYRRYGYYILLISLPWLAILFLFIVPHVNLEIFHSYKYGTSFRAAVIYFMSHPAEIIQAMWSVLPGLAMAYLAHPIALPIFYPIFLLPIILTLPILLFRTDTTDIFINLAFVYLSVVWAIRFLVSRNNSKAFKRFIAVSLVIFGCLSHYFYHYNFIDRSVGIIPFSRGFSLKNISPARHALIGMKLIRDIPGDTSCFTVSFVAQRLGHLKKTGVYNVTPLNNHLEWDYYLFPLKDLNFAAWRFDYDDYMKTIKQILETRHYKIQAYDDGWLLLRKVTTYNLNTGKLEAALRDIDKLQGMHR